MDSLHATRSSVLKVRGNLQTAIAPRFRALVNFGKADVGKSIPRPDRPANWPATPGIPGRVGAVAFRTILPRWQSPHRQRFCAILRQETEIRNQGSGVRSQRKVFLTPDPCPLTPAEYPP